MKSKTMWFSAALLLLVAVTAQAQEETKKAPFEWKTSGDTVETFKAEFVVNTPVDQSTPEGLVNGYTALTDNRTEYAKMTQEYYAKGATVVKAATKPLFEKLLSEEMMKFRMDAEAAAEKEEDSTYISEATTIVGVTDGKDGAKLVETLQKGSYMSEGWDPETGQPTGKMEENKWETKTRLTVVKGEGDKWRIERIENMQKNWEKADEMGNAPDEWMEVNNAISWYLEERKPEVATELKQDTPENAALSLFNSVFRNRDNWYAEIYARGIKGWVDAVKPLFTEKGLKGPAEDGEKYETPSSTREVDKVKDGADGVKMVKLKSRSEWSGPVEVHVKKIGEVWKIVNAGYYDMEWTDMGEMVEGEFKESKDLDTLGWR
jgi:hypothetical protein